MRFLPDLPLEGEGEDGGGYGGEDQVVEDGYGCHHRQHHQPEPQEHVDLVSQHVARDGYIDKYVIYLDG